MWWLVHLQKCHTFNDFWLLVDSNQEICHCKQAINCRLSPSMFFYVLVLKCIHHGFCSLYLPCLYFSPKYSFPPLAFQHVYFYLLSLLYLFPPIKFPNSLFCISSYYFTFRNSISTPVRVCLDFISTVHAASQYLVYCLLTILSNENILVCKQRDILIF